MVEIEHALRNYLVNPNDLDLGFAMAALARKTKAHYRELGGNLKKEAVTLGKTFAIDLKIGKWPDVLDGRFENNFKTKTVSFLKKINGDVHKAAELMLKQCLKTVEKNAGLKKP
ncbi:MAG: hypothetical protein IKB43_02555 [Fibrobacter sp.]|nr:hypothetical protein [Fibrobacter sp.]MBR2469024.1 hypothetical protein [Fibrobacter sp.]